ncbi:prolyl endopeptidase [Photinus pyralis]|uniref:prolyl endopeptidase n=1 Tax=Photinus pyralis TaxID=7054 RepID=UPI001266F9BB|nr:prolyl endopeptidase [Photinus pyralis]
MFTLTAFRKYRNCIVQCLQVSLLRSHLSINKKMPFFRYPDVRRDNRVIDVYHGIPVADPYRWLENPDSEETREFIEKQNAMTTPYIDSCEFKQSIIECLTSVWNYPKVSSPQLHGTKYYQLKNSGLQNQSVMYKFEQLNGRGQIFLDPNTFSEDGTVAMVAYMFSLDGKTLAYGVSTSGQLLLKLNAYLDQTGKTDGSETETSTNQKLYCHKLGTPQSEDVVIVEFDDPEIRCQTTISDCREYLVLTPVKGCKNNLLSFCHLKDVTTITGKLPVTPIVTEFKSDFEFVANNGSKFIFLTNHNAPNYQLIEIDFNNYAEENWKVVIPEHSRDVLDWAKPINGYFIVTCYIRDVKDTLSLYSMDNYQKVLEFPLPHGSVSGFSGKRDDSRMFFGFTSFLIPYDIYTVDFTEEPLNLVKWHQTVLPNFNPDNYICKQVFYSAIDGTQIPMSIVHKKNLVMEGENPCLLYGYGGFNVTIGPSFSVSRLVFMDKFNGIFAVANIRGGGEYGEKWHNAGRFKNKQLVFDDFQRAAWYLIDKDYTCSEKLTIQGASNGGLLVAACINQQPYLYGCALCLVGVLDMLRYHKFTIGYAWKSDYGCSDDAGQFDYLFKYSPLHNIKRPTEKGIVEYPATLLLTGDHDDRVVPLHSYKFIAELQYKVGQSYDQTKPLLIRIDTNSGHGAGKPTSKLIEEQAEMLCFMQKSLNLQYFD